MCLFSSEVTRPRLQRQEVMRPRSWTLWSGPWTWAHDHCSASTFEVRRPGLSSRFTAHWPTGMQVSKPPQLVLSALLFKHKHMWLYVNTWVTISCVFNVVFIFLSRLTLPLSSSTSSPRGSARPSPSFMLTPQYWSFCGFLYDHIIIHMQTEHTQTRFV